MSTSGTLKSKKLSLQNNAAGVDYSMSVSNADEFELKRGQDVLLSVAPDVEQVLGGVSEEVTKLKIVKDSIFEQNVEIKGNLNVQNIIKTKLPTAPYRITSSGCNFGIPNDYNFADDADFPGVESVSFMAQKEILTLSTGVKIPISGLFPVFFNWATTVKNHNYIWNSYNILEPDFHIGAGDNSYNELTFDRNIGDFIANQFNVGRKNVYDEAGELVEQVDLTEEEVVDTMKIIYSKNEEFMSFINNVGKDNMMINFDDHDYGWNNGYGDYKYSDFYGNAVKTFWTNEVGLTTMPPKNQGGYSSQMRDAGDHKVQIISLDPHYYANVEDDGVGVSDSGAYTIVNAFNRNVYVQSNDSSILGEVQWAWLETELLKEADLRVITMGPKVFFTTSTQSNINSFQNYPFELQRLSNLIRKCKANGIVFVTCDSHQGSISKAGDDFPYPIHNIHTCSIDHNEATSATNTGLVGDRLAVPNYPTCESSKQNQTGIMCIDFHHDAVEPYIEIGHKRIYGVGVDRKTAKDSSLWHRELVDNHTVCVPLSSLVVKEDVPSDFNWRTDMSSYPLEHSTTVQTKNWVAEQLLNQVQSPLDGTRDPIHL